MEEKYNAFGEMDSALFKVMFPVLVALCWLNDLEILAWVISIAAFLGVLIVSAFVAGFFNLGERGRLAFYFITLSLMMVLPFLL